MSTHTYRLVNDLEQMGVNLSITNNRLLVDAPKGIITPVLKEQLKIAKHEIVSVLQHRSLQNKRTTQLNTTNNPTPVKMKVYKIKVNGKSVTVLDPSGLPSDEMKRVLKTKFGDRLNEEEE